MTSYAVGENAPTLDPAAVAAGVSLVAFDTLDSTNAEALRRAREGEAGPLWITAARQTAGRGRRGRAWTSAPGNLFASLLLSDPAPIPEASQISFVAALAVHDAVRAVAPALAGRLTLKWPNDLLCSGKKLAGILVEGETRRTLAVVVGIGINCLHHPDEALYPTTDLAAEGEPASAAAVFTALAAAMQARLAEWDRSRGFPSIRAAWLARGPAPGTPLRVRFEGTETAGAFESIDDHGNLLISGDEGVHKIAAGDVFPLAQPDALSSNRRRP
ncbi:biotin--[acetyl-CoA-carboxylase] ligase [Rhodoplanes sp. TEM]|uniref:biotin--[biotin carboxyl-carrier protein] ligase n=1 Tax=Rhodoplanes tepidamans TaxID=200616 RepID=A0ABT5JB46_RHOTP|nr:MULTISPECIES: biotin--[acetyl-CoA-carboxylase] ligase [Rhodoplanes]MDC7786499.1 biotin--[acetyl-CoA-carboxylase] ligase [Rhodoplanes tepidamans]MDC7985498.1 biotin--[acetyl-CoA-carboxylase] ligase [Rhodoplanes sp. TEM]MDQ0357384.1 BirA family biotin operon repressor/biotin-[acetyl-CoA-carboxylase] ligase [Rhodoplanes tepidamans]